MSASEERPVRIGGGALPPGFARRAHAIAPGDERAADAAGWGDAVVVVERGQIELTRRGGTRARFGRGDVVWVAAGSLRALRNPGRGRALHLAGVRSAEFPGRSRSQPGKATWRTTT